MTISWRKFLMLPALLFLGMIVPTLAQALTISPARFEIETDPGTKVSGEILLMNEQSEAKTFYSTFENFEANGDTGTPNFVPGKEGLASWMATDASITLNPGEEKRIPFTIDVPAGARPGGYFAAVFWGTTPVESATNNISVGARIGMLVLLRVSGDVKQGGGIGEIDTESGEVLFSTLPITLTYVFNNDGDDRLNPNGTITVRNIIGIKVAELDANASDGNILPRSSRKYKVPWGKPKEKDGFFNNAFYELRHFAIGPYKVTAELTYGAKEELTDKASKYIWFFPWQILSMMLVVALISWMIFVKIVKTRRRMLRRQRELEAKIRELEKKTVGAPTPTKRLSEIKNPRTIQK